MRNRGVLFVLVVFLVSLTMHTSVVFAIDASQETQQEKIQLQKQLQEIEQQIAAQESELKEIKGQKNTLQNKLSVLKKQQTTTALKIKQATLLVRSAQTQLQDVVSTIEKNETRIATLKSEMGEALIQMHQNDHRSFLLTLFSSTSLFDALSEYEQFKQVSSGLTVLLGELRNSQEDLALQRQTLDEESEHLQQLLAMQVLEQASLNTSTAEQASLLSQTKGQEKTYQALLSDSKKQASAIQSRLYQLLDVGKQITFGQAVEIAQEVSKTTGVRAAFLLAILTQESNLGKNVGTCNRPGDPASKSWKVIMKPTRDQEPFKTITSELGLDIDTTAVSCPMRDKNGNQVGWGGAMGPAQFIPSTWMGYRAKITAITGLPANPWDIRDAFIASGLKLGHDGATSVDGEWAAAMRYFSGSTNTRFRFYGDNVVATAEEYQKDIDALGN